jgi:hypothetical protein
VHLLPALAVEGLLEVGLEDLRGLRRKSTGKIGWVARLDLLGLEFRTARVLVQPDWIHEELVESTAQLVLVLEEHEQLNFVIGRLLDWPNHMPSGRDLLLLLDGRELLPAAGKLELHQVLGDDVVEDLLELGPSAKVNWLGVRSSTKSKAVENFELWSHAQEVVEGEEPPGVVFVRHVVSQKIGGEERQIQGGQVEVDALGQVQETRRSSVHHAYAQQTHDHPPY